MNQRRLNFIRNRWLNFVLVSFSTLHWFSFIHIIIGCPCSFYCSLLKDVASLKHAYTKRHQHLKHYTCTEINYGNEQEHYKKYQEHYRYTLKLNSLSRKVYISKNIKHISENIIHMSGNIMYIKVELGLRATKHDT